MLLQSGKRLRHRGRWPRDEVVNIKPILHGGLSALRHEISHSNNDEPAHSLTVGKA